MSEDFLRYIPPGAEESERQRTRPTQAIYAVLAENPNSGEDIAGIHTFDGWVPLVMTGDGNHEVLRIAARKLQSLMGSDTPPLRLVRFTSREVVEEFLPKKEPTP